MCDNSLLQCLEYAYQEACDHHQSILDSPHDNMGGVCKLAYYITYLKTQVIPPLKKELADVKAELETYKQKMAKTYMVLEDDYVQCH